MWVRSRVAAAALAFSSLLTACGGGGDDATTPALPASTEAPTGLVIGYYLEDAVTNPEDPMPGTFYMNLPEEGAYSGAMYFTYVGCQSENVGTISGIKQRGGDLSGQWEGHVDGHTVGGGYQATYDAITGLYSGTFTNAAGKLEVDVPNCIHYHVAPKGSLSLFPLDVTWPATFGLNQAANGVISWTHPVGAGSVFITVIDKARALQGGADTVLEQAFDVATPGPHLFDASPYKGGGQESIVLVVVMDEAGNLLAYSSVTVQ